MFYNYMDKYKLTKASEDILEITRKINSINAKKKKYNEFLDYYLTTNKNDDIVLSETLCPITTNCKLAFVEQKFTSCYKHYSNKDEYNELITKREKYLKEYSELTKGNTTHG